MATMPSNSKFPLDSHRLSFLPSRSSKSLQIVQRFKIVPHADKYYWPNKNRHYFLISPSINSFITTVKHHRTSRPLKIAVRRRPARTQAFIPGLISSWSKNCKIFFIWIRFFKATKIGIKDWSNLILVLISFKFCCTKRFFLIKSLKIWDFVRNENRKPIRNLKSSWARLDLDVCPLSFEFTFIDMPLLKRYRKGDQIFWIQLTFTENGLEWKGSRKSNQKC